MKVRLKDFFFDLNEANLTGKSRTGQIPNWDFYVVKGFDKNKPFFIETNTVIFDDAFTSIKNLSKGTEVKIQSTDLVQYKNSKYAKVQVKNIEGLVNINAIQKPTTSTEGSVIPGGKNSKEFTPAKLGLEGKSFSNVSSMISEINSVLRSNYSDPKYYNIKKYISECIRSTTGVSIEINESFSKSFPISKYDVSDADINVLSKNFGEVLGALYLLKTNKKAAKIEFPADVSQGLYDIIMVDTDGITNYYSLKSKGGSSTSISNINFVLNNFSKNNSILKTYQHEVSVIRSLMNDKDGGITTLTNIENFYNQILTTEKRKILSKLNSISKIKISSLSQKDLTKWFTDMVNTSTVEEFKSVMNDIYNNILSGVKTTPDVLDEMYKSKSGEKYNNGYLYYPMGQYIVSYLNTTGKYKDVLNVLLNFGSYIHQITVDMYSERLTISIASFKKSKFRFSYNAGSKYPANRPLGFKKI
jgi:hypothetical protein